MSSGKKAAPSVVKWIGLFAAMVLVSFFTTFGVLAVTGWREPPIAEPTASYDASGVTGISCNDGKTFITTTRSGGFLTSSGVFVDGQSVECGMTYKVDGKEISALDVLQHGMKN
jgi:hypothetical protein